MQAVGEAGIVRPPCQRASDGHRRRFSVEYRMSKRIALRGLPESTESM